MPTQQGPGVVSTRTPSPRLQAAAGRIAQKVRAELGGPLEEMRALSARLLELRLPGAAHSAAQLLAHAAQRVTASVEELEDTAARALAEDPMLARPEHHAPAPLTHALADELTSLVRHADDAQRGAQAGPLQPRIRRAARLANIWLSATADLDPLVGTPEVPRPSTTALGPPGLESPRDRTRPLEEPPGAPGPGRGSEPSGAAGGTAARALADRLARVEAQLVALQGRFDDRERHYRAVSHEIRNAAHAFTSWAYLLRHSELSATPWFAPLGRAADALQRRAEEASALSSNSDFSISIRSFDLLPIAAQALELVRPMADSAGVTLSIAVPRRTAAMAVRADPDRAAQVLHNLLRNAIEATPHGGSVRVSSAVVGGRAEVSVEDSGPGIPAARAATIFDGLDSGATSLTEGFGVGLRLSHSLAERMGGSLELRDRVDGATGACFVLAVPLDPA